MRRPVRKVPANGMFLGRISGNLTLFGKGGTGRERGKLTRDNVQ
jgi:hypothetical protein